MQFSIDPHQVGGYISPLLFGHNLEHTRSCMWRGLCAELIRNRKFAGKPQQLSGVAAEWYPIGSPHTFFLLDDKGTYTRHYLALQRRRSRRHNAVHSQLIQICGEGERCGIGQDKVPIEAGRQYTLRLAIKGSEGRTVSVALMNADRSSTYFSAELSASEQWQTSEFELRGSTTDADARLEITFEGVAEARVGSVSLLESDSFLGMRRDVVALLKEIGAAILRWPGGNFAGDYRWQDGLLEPDMRPPINTWHEVETLPHTFGFDFHEVGTDEFVALCREVGAEPFISLNLAWDSSAECAAWVEYCNGAETTEWGRLRAARGHAEPFGVRYWSLGNELGHGHMEGPNTTRAYVEKASACAAAIRQVDPSVELVMSGDWREEQWFTEGLRPLAGDVDHIALHQYDSALSTYIGPEAAAQFEHLVTAPARTEGRFRDTRAKVDAVTPKSRSIGISFDEWNVWYAWYRTPGVAEGLYAAGMLNTLCRISAETRVIIGCYFEPINEGAIVVEPYSARLTPVGQVFSLYKPHQGNRLIEALCSEPDGLVAGIASVDAASGAIVITLVNRSPETHTDVRLEVLESSYAPVSKGILLTGRDFAPASVFESQSLSWKESDGGEVTVRLPKLSVARLVFAPSG